MAAFEPNPATPTASLEERKFQQDTASKQRELDLKERDIAAREREVAAKEIELNRSRLLSPTVIGLGIAALTLIVNLFLARINNSNTQDVERGRAQSSLVLEAIKTGSTDKACQNLIFFVKLGLLEDKGNAIRSNCANAPVGPPSLPQNTLSFLPNFDLIHGRVIDQDSQAPIEGAEILIGISQPLRTFTDKGGWFSIKRPDTSVVYPLTVQKQGYNTERTLAVAGGEMDVVMKKNN